MTDTEKLRLIEAISAGKYDWLASYRATFRVPHGHGCPSGLTGSETATALIRKVLRGEHIVLVGR